MADFGAVRRNSPGTSGWRPGVGVPKKSRPVFVTDLCLNPPHSGKFELYTSTNIPMAKEKQHAAKWDPNVDMGPYGSDPVIPLLPPARRKRNPMTPEAKEALLEALENGMTMRRFLALRPDLPGPQAFFNEMERDPAFKQAYELARQAGSTDLIEEALEHQLSVRNNKDLSIAASKYTDAALKAAAMLAPKSFGPMLRHANADGENLTVQVIQFAPTPKEGGELIATATPVQQIEDKGE